MKNQPLIILFFLLPGLSCTETIIGPSSGANLLTNPTFEWNSVPSLYGWTVSDTTGMQFSTDVPPGGSGKSILLPPMGFPESPEGAVYQIIPASEGSHKYMISVFGKTTESFLATHFFLGSVGIVLNRPGGSNTTNLPGITVADTMWKFYFRIDTINAVAGDTIFVTISGGACEVCPIAATTSFNTCKFEKLD